MRLAIAAAALCLLAATPASAAPGAPDPSFGSGGYVHARFGPMDDGASVHRLANGRLLVAGSVYGLRDERFGSDGSAFLLARYLPNGRLDPSFGSGGSVRTRFGRYSSATKVIELPDRKLLVVGRTLWGYDAFRPGVALARYLPDGRPDRTFGDGGRVTVPVPGYDQVGVGDVERRPDGRLVIVGYVAGNHDRPLVMRLHANGRPDTSFGKGGIVLPTWTWGSNASAESVELLPDGSAVVLGDYYGYPFLVRFLPDGTQDGEFGANGSTVPGMEHVTLGGLLRLRDGSFLAGGHRSSMSIKDVTPSTTAVVVRFRPDGEHDTSFGVLGWAWCAEATEHNHISQVGTLPDGRIVGVGQVWRDNSDTLLLRLTRDGKRDRSFDGDGAVVTGHPTLNDAGSRLLLDANGRITMLGSTWTPNSATGFHAMLARYLG